MKGKFVPTTIFGKFMKIYRFWKTLLDHPLCGFTMALLSSHYFSSTHPIDKQEEDKLRDACSVSTK